MKGNTGPGGVGQSQYVGGRLGRKNASHVTSAKRKARSTCTGPWLHPLSPTCTYVGDRELGRDFTGLVRGYPTMVNSTQ